jgi:hypothetical protein
LPSAPGNTITEERRGAPLLLGHELEVRQPHVATAPKPALDAIANLTAIRGDAQG